MIILPVFLKKKLKGFTLIEIIVVLVIICILVGIVLVSLGSTRTKAKNARIISEMHEIRNMATSYYSGNNRSFDGISCSSLSTYCEDINGLLGDGGNVEVIGYGSYFCAKTPLIGGGWWCEDSLTGKAGRYDVEPDCSSDIPECVDSGGWE